MKKILYLGSCGSNWPPNTTPIQRAIFLERHFEIDYVDTADTLHEFLGKNIGTRYYKVDKFSLNNVDTLSNNIIYDYIWCGPSWKVVAIAQKLARNIRAKIVIDMFDHERLPAGVAWNKNQFIKAIYFELMALKLREMIKECDIFIHAIGNDISSYSLNKNTQTVHCLNGQSPELISSIRNINTSEGGFSICYVGEASDERTPILKSILQTANILDTELNLNIVGFCNKKYLKEIKECAGSKINVFFHPFMPWVDAMQIVLASDLCLHLFPDRQDLACVYPLKIAEYLALGKPVLAPNLPGVIMMLGKSLIECVMPNSDPMKWVNFFIEIKGNSTLRNSLKDKALLRAKELEWDTIHSPLLDILKKNE